MSASLIVIFGAAVRPDGSPSPALLRRVLYGLDAASDHPETPVLCSGGVGRAGPSEASIMAEALTDLGLSPERILLDEASLDTLQSCVAAARMARTRPDDGRVVVVVSDSYHLPRIRMMLTLLGVRSAPGRIGGDRPRPSLGHLTKMGLRECAAYPYDMALTLMRRRRPAS